MDLFLQRVGKAQYVILGIVGNKIIAVDHFNDDRCLPCVRLIEACNDNMGFSGRNDMIADCEPVTGNNYA